MGKVFDALEKAMDKEGIDDLSATPVEQPAPVAAPSPGGKRKHPGSAPLRGPAAAGGKEEADEAPQDMPVQTGNWDDKLVVVKQPSSIIADNFRRLRTKIFHPAEGQPPRSILVTSAAPQEGKSFVCANLGAAIAQGMEKHALLVDCDLRRPALAPMLGLSSAKGLVNHLRDNVDIGDIILKTDLGKLSVIPSGPPPANPAELLDSDKMVKVIDEIVSRYHDRYIILDSPPVFAASETAVLAKHVDGIVLVVRAGRAGRDAVKKLVDMIGTGKIVGVVFNAFERGALDDKLQSYYNYTYGGEYYRQGKSR